MAPQDRACFLPHAGDAIGDLTEEESVASGYTKLSARRTRILSAVAPGENYRCLPDDLLVETLDSIGWRRPDKRLCSRLGYSTVPSTLRTGPECKHSTFPIHPGHPFNDIQSDGMVRFGGGRRPALLEPSPTVRTDPRRDLLIRPDVTRCLSVLEYLRIQGIRTPFQLFGNLKDRYCQVGNGIPPLLMEAVCKAVYWAVYAASTPSAIQVSHEAVTLANHRQELLK